MQGGMNMNSLLNNGNNNNMSPSHHHQISLQDLHNPIHGSHSFDPAAGDHDFLDQMFSTINPSWADLNPAADGPDPAPDSNGNSIGPFGTHFDESAILASKLRQHQISGGGGSSSTSAAAAAKALLLQQQMLMGRGFERSPSDVPGVDESVQALYNGFAGSLHGGGGGQLLNQSPQFHHPQGGTPSFGAQRQGTKPAPAASASTTTASGGGGNTTNTSGQPRQRVRARRGQATDPHSIAERLRRERIAERMKALQELVPNGNKTDKASMLDEIIDYVKFLQLQVKVLSMSRLGGAAAVAPLVAYMSSEGAGGGDCNGGGRNGNGSANDSLTVTEHQVAKLMEEDMGSAMQYLQGKGLCLMPISLATAISTATCHSSRPSAAAHGNPLTASNGDGPTSPSMSVLTVQSAAGANGGGPDGSSAKDAASVSKS
ncbi:hypothetical protein CRG98_027259 [Punica granatum]|uniref:BHLH domain-containing protein n=1 Tax=Punica granatum TaxID=22663 RepID=A0A2I0J8I5_PUNGR|nr:hypothetical protein CRG98_027259 [Punica granatum]